MLQFQLPPSDVIPGERGEGCYLRRLISVSVKNQYQHLYQLGTVPKNLSVLLTSLCSTVQKGFSVLLATCNGTESFFGTVGHVQWYRKVFRY